MKRLTQLSILIFLIAFTQFSFAISSEKKTNPEFSSLSGVTLNAGNQVNSEGKITEVKSPVLHFIRSKAKTMKGTVLLFPGGEYQVLNAKNQCDKTVLFLNVEGYDVALLEYRIGSDDSRKLALIDALQAIRKLKFEAGSVGLHDGQLNLMGIGSGGQLAARAVQRLAEKEQPDKLILISPIHLDETLKGTVFSGSDASGSANCWPFCEFFSK